VDECPLGSFISENQNNDDFSLSQNQCQGIFLYFILLYFEMYLMGKN